MTDARSESFLWISGAEKPGRPLLDEEAADRAVVRARPDGRDVGDRPVRDPHLGAVQDPVGAVAARVRAHRAGVGARVGLGEAEAADRLAGVHRRQPALLLLLGAPAPDREHRERALHRDRAADARVARLELEAGEAVGDGARAREAVALEVHPEEAELAELGDQLARQDPLLEPVADLGKDRSRTNWRTVSRIARSSSSSSASRARKSSGSSAVCVSATAIALIVEKEACVGATQAFGSRPAHWRRGNGGTERARARARADRLRPRSDGCSTDSLRSISSPS